MRQVVLITGGLGYVGARLAAYLSRNARYYLRLTSSREFHSSPLRLANSVIEHLDVRSPRGVKRACRGVSVVVHLAGLNASRSEIDYQQAIEVNVTGTERLLEAAQACGVKRFIYFSTAHVYGSPLIGTISETTLPVPRHPYAITHRAAEDFVLSAKQGVVLRLSNGVGAPVLSSTDCWTLVVNDLCRQAVTHGQLKLKSSGLQQRDFISLENVCRALVHVMRLPNCRAAQQIYNLGAGRSLSIMELAGMIARRSARILGYTPKIIRPQPQPQERGRPLNYQVGKLAATGFKQDDDLAEAIDETLLFCKSAFKPERV